MKYVYPVIFENAEEGGYIVKVPDIPYCYTQGDNMADALIMAQDVIGMTLSDYEDENKEIPKPSEIKEIEKNTNGIVSLVVADTTEWRQSVDNKIVKKTLSLPSWLNKKAEKMSINFSQTLQEALCQKLGVIL